MLSVCDLIMLVPKSPFGTFSSFNSRYLLYLSDHVMNMKTTRPTNKCVPTTNIEAFLKPILSYKIPLTDGPINAPRANVLVHKPDIRPNVSKLLGNPCELKNYTKFNTSN